MNRQPPPLSTAQPFSPAPNRSAPAGTRKGLAFGLAAYGLWGVIPIYFKQLAVISPVDIVAHRIVWSMPFLALLLAGAHRWGDIRLILSDRRTLAILGVTTLLIAINWLLYVYSVVSGHILASSFGYYLNPFANILLGRFVLSERLTRLQWTGIGIAAAGVSVLAVGALAQLWLSLTLCVTFSLYGLLRKMAKADALVGLAVETTFLFPFAIAWLAFGIAGGRPVLGESPAEFALLAAAGVVSTTPLLMFNAAARRLKYSTMGMLQFLAPTLQFLIAVFLYGERFTAAHAVAFASIWVALMLYVAAASSRPQPPIPPE